VTGETISFRVFQREHLRPGDSIAGPAAVEEPGTTTIVDAGDNLSVEDHGCLMIQIAPSEATGTEHLSSRGPA
jgi:N-methylhydantoinase A/oxoprolinase/acetone carboxylase beta subunit